jgi:hypothetical protein
MSSCVAFPETKTAHFTSPECISVFGLNQMPAADGLARLLCFASYRLFFLHNALRNAMQILIKKGALIARILFPPSMLDQIEILD